jgi:hypothetical protein
MPEVPHWVLLAKRLLEKPPMRPIETRAMRGVVWRAGELRGFPRLRFAESKGYEVSLILEGRENWLAFCKDDRPVMMLVDVMFELERTAQSEHDEAGAERAAQDDAGGAAA